ncbi:hypothetical protein [Arenibacterium sp. LLYu02]|uniref:dioxygenase family protein n=1 Tax=Arenibacterium sp. LLYu02 TaxID=3404132 RepID=UPI003B227113
MKLTRRVTIGGLLLASARPLAGLAQPAAALAPTPACGSFPTPPQESGPFHLEGAPQRRTLWPAGRAQPFRLSGRVLDQQCRPIPAARIEVWHADDEGRYDNRGYDGRGWQVTGETGEWQFDTIMTSHYSFRTAHYHFRIAAEGFAELTTQLYLPEHPRNGEDHLFDPALVLQMAGDRRSGVFDFVLS